MRTIAKFFAMVIIFALLVSGCDSASGGGAGGTDNGVVRGPLREGDPDFPANDAVKDYEDGDSTTPDKIPTTAVGTDNLDANGSYVNSEPVRLGTHNTTLASELDQIPVFNKLPTANEVTNLAKGLYPAAPRANKWTKKKVITVTGGGSAVTDYLHKVTVTYDADMVNDFSDIRFADADGRLLPQFRKSYTPGSTAEFWVKLHGVTSASAATRDITMFYGNHFDVGLPWNNDDPALAPVAQGFGSRFFPRNITEDRGWRGTKIVYHGGKLIAASSRSGNVYFEGSSDGGKTFSRISTNTTLKKGGGLAATPDDSRLLALAWTGPDTRKFAYSTDGGVTFSTPVTIASGRNKEADLVALSNTEYFVASEKLDKDDIKIYRTTNSGTSWSEYSTVASGILAVATNGAEDVGLYKLSNGDFACIWEEEDTEKGKSQIYMKISDDECATWGSKISVWTQASTTYDYEPAGLFEDRDGNLVSMIYTNVDDGGADSNYQKYLTRYKISNDGGATWDAPGTGTVLHNLHGIGPENRLIKVGNDIYVVGYKAWAKGGSFIYKIHDDLSPAEMISGQLQTGNGSIFVDSFGNAEVTPLLSGSDKRGFVVSTATMPNDQRILASMVSSSVHGRLVFRYQDMNNHYMLAISDAGSTVYKRVSGTHTSISTDATGYDFGIAYHDVEVTVIGTTIKVWIDGNLEHNFTDSTYRSGKVGMSVEGGTTSWFDYFIGGEAIASEPANSFGSEASHSIMLTPEQMSPQMKNIDTAGGLSYGG